MKRSLLLLALGIALFSPSLARAGETPEAELDFARKLRGKHYSDLALEYLEKLSKSAPPEMAPLLALEIARTRISLAEEKEPGQRAPLFAQARKELEAFLQANAEHPEAAQARVEVARMAALQGKALLSIGLREETREAQIAGALKARQQFIDAGKELDSAVKQLAERQRKYASATTPAEKLLKAKADEGYLQILVDRATNYLDQAETYIDQASDKTLKERAEVIEEAKKTLNKVAATETKSSESTLARAWLVRCLQMTDSPKEASNLYKRIMNETGASAKPGQRLAWYFYIRGLPQDPTVGKDRDKEIIRQATGWLKANPNARNTAQGQGVRFELDRAEVAEAKAQKGTPNTALLRQAQKDLALLAAGDSDIASQAGELSLMLSVDRVKDLPLAKINGFDDCFLKARYDIYLLQKTLEEMEKKEGPERATLEAKRKDYFKEITAALRRALRLADDKTTAGQLGEARYYLTFVYLSSGDPYRAAVLGETAARAKPPSKRSASAADYALEAYARVLDEPEGDTDGNRARLRQLAEFVLKDRAALWAKEPVTALARYELAMVNLREKKYRAVIDGLEQLPSDFHRYVVSQCQLAILALSQAREAESPQERKALQDRALQALQRVPNLPPHSDLMTVQMFFQAQLEKGSLLYTNGMAVLQKGDIPQASEQFQKLEQFTAGLNQQFEKLDVKLSPDVHGKFAFALGNLRKYSQLGRANTEYRVGNYDQVIALTEEAVKAVKDLGKQDGPIVMKDYKVTGALLGLNVRARVQKGAMADAKALWPLLQRLKGEDSLESDASGVLQGLIQDLRTQVKALQEKAKTDPTAKVQLEAMAGNFMTFFQELSKQTDQKTMMQNLFFIANCYGSLGKHKEAADLYARYEPPKDKEGKDAATFWFVQLQRARELRLAGKDALDAGMAKEAKERFAEARDVLSKIPPPFKSFQILQEEVFQLEDQRLYGTAVGEWGKLMKNPYLQKRLATDNDAKKQYFDCYYHTIYCWYEYGKNQKDRTKHDGAIKKAAELIVRLENAPPQSQDGWQLLGARLRALMETEPLLRAQYEQLRKMKS